MTPKYGRYDGDAVRFTDDEAWVLVNGTWHEMNPADAVFEAALLTEQAFHRKQVPPLPPAAFSGDPWHRAKRRAKSDQRMLDDDAKQGGSHAQHMIARRTAPNGPDPDPARYAAALARAREIYGQVLDSYSPEWKAALGIGGTGPKAQAQRVVAEGRASIEEAKGLGKSNSGGWRSPLV
jgi:hypothetical protein